MPTTSCVARDRRRRGVSRYHANQFWPIDVRGHLQAGTTSALGKVRNNQGAIDEHNQPHSKAADHKIFPPMSSS